MPLGLADNLTGKRGVAGEGEEGAQELHIASGKVLTECTRQDAYHPPPLDTPNLSMVSLLELREK